jgi:hypothetical protein
MSDLADWLAGLVGWLGWLVGLDGWLAWMVGWLGWLAGWLAWMVGWLAGWLGWLAGMGRLFWGGFFLRTGGGLDRPDRRQVSPFFTCGWFCGVLV